MPAVCLAPEQGLRSGPYELEVLLEGHGGELVEDLDDVGDEERRGSVEREVEGGMAAAVVTIGVSSRGSRARGQPVRGWPFVA